MAEPFIASTQYGDLKGTVSFDGHDGPPLHELAQRTNMPSGYIPVGFQTWRLGADEDGMIRFQIVAVDTREAGTSIDEIIMFAQSHELPVYPFDGQIAFVEFVALFKRFDLKVVHKSLKKANIQLYNTP